MKGKVLLANLIHTINLSSVAQRIKKQSVVSENWL